MMAKILTQVKDTLKNKKVWLVLVAGLFLTFAYSPFNVWPIAFASVAALYFCGYKQSLKASALYGFVFGLGWFGAGISWVHVSISQFGGLPILASVALMALLVCYLALYPALALALTAWIYKRTGSWFAPFMLFFAIAEVLRGTLLTGFPWLSFGYTQTDSPLNFFAPIGGEFSLTLIVLAVSFGFYQLIAKRYWGPLISITAVLTVIAMSSQWLQPASYANKQLSVALVQGNIAQSMRWEPENFGPTMLKYQDLTRQHWDVDLVVWPEAAIPELEVYAGEFLQTLDAAATFNNAALITGIVDYQYDTRNVYNTLIAIGKKDDDSTQGQYRYLHKNRYRKHQLLPIGEFVPFEDLLRPLAPLFDLPMSSFTRGERVQDNLLANGYHILPAICYEIVFSELVRDNYRSDSDILFTVSNDAWFGDSHGPHQHMQISRMRALELMRPLVRVTNTGITAVYDPISKQQVSLAQFSDDVLVADIQLITGDSIYARHGNWPWWLLVILFTLVSVSWRLHKRKGA